jgi:hypothetical protein
LGPRAGDHARVEAEGIDGRCPEQLENELDADPTTTAEL